MQQINIQYLKTAYGELIIGGFDGKLCLCDWRHRRMREAIDKRIKNRLAATYVQAVDEVSDRAITQLQEYFAGNRQVFDLSLQLSGTEFQIKVWQHLLKVTYGMTASYAQLSKKMNNSQAVRAVAAANGANAISIIIPCHRIIGSNGKLIGYAGGLDTKQKLLQLEGCSSGRGMTYSMDLLGNT